MGFFIRFGKLGARNSNSAAGKQKCIPAYSAAYSSAYAHCTKPKKFYPAYSKAYAAAYAKKDYTHWKK